MVQSDAIWTILVVKLRNLGNLIGIDLRFYGPLIPPPCVRASVRSYKFSKTQWRIQNFIMGGGRSRGRGLGRSCAPPQKKFEILPENGGFWCILGLLFTFMQKLVRPMKGRLPPPPPPGSATGKTHCVEPWAHVWGIPFDNSFKVQHAVFLQHCCLLIFLADAAEWRSSWHRWCCQNTSNYRSTQPAEYYTQMRCDKLHRKRSL